MCGRSGALLIPITLSPLRLAFLGWSTEGFVFVASIFSTQEYRSAPKVCYLRRSQLTKSIPVFRSVRKVCGPNAHVYPFQPIDPISAHCAPSVSPAPWALSSSHNLSRGALSTNSGSVIKKPKNTVS